MGEIKQLAVLVTACLIIGVIGIVLSTVLPPLFEGDLTVSSYTATLYDNGTLTERYTYDVKTSGEYHMLYRSWEEPLLFTTPAQPSVEIVSATPPSGTIAYAKDDSGNVAVYGDSSAASYASIIGRSAQDDEAGIFSPGSFAAGQYTVAYTYVLYPPIEFDGSTTHLNLKFAGQSHIPYHDITIMVPADGIQQVFAYPPTLGTVLSGNTYTFSGDAAADENIAVEMLGGSTAFSQIPGGFRTQVTGLAASTTSGSFWYDAVYTLSYLLNYLAKAAVILVPLLFLVIYRWYGTEKKFTVPAYLSTNPNPALKPWQVNLLFKDDALDFDETGYYATLLDLHRRKFITITTKQEGAAKDFEIRILKTTSDDPYEQRVLNVLGQIAENGVLDSGHIEKLASEAATNIASEETALRYQRMLTDVTRRVDPSLALQYIVDGRDHIVPLLLASITVFAVTLIFAFLEPMQSYILIPATVLWGVVFVQAVIAIVMPSTLFGHWKGDKHKEKLEWDAFAHFLSDLAQMRKYAPEDLSMWGEWLVYGTALGVGDKVESAMASLNINSPRPESLPVHWE